MKRWNWLAGLPFALTDDQIKQLVDIQLDDNHLSAVLRKGIAWKRDEMLNEAFMSKLLEFWEGAK
jgi:hypothetical protein